MCRNESRSKYVSIEVRSGKGQMVALLFYAGEHLLTPALDKNEANANGHVCRWKVPNSRVLLANFFDE